MVKITFKNVGQGDSILLEWNEDGVDKIAIIDCNIFLGSNPVLEHVIEKGYKNIDFMILSHPHLDHFSGYIELLNYCKAQNIQIRRFLHTAQTSPDFLKAATRSIEEKNKLYELFKLLNDLVEEDFLSVYAIDDNPDVKIKLGDEFIMEILSPSSREIAKYINGENYPFDEETVSHPNANWLSTILKISNGQLNVLLTSDVETGALRRIGKKNGGRLGKDKIILAQIPHHGSRGNLDKPFWSMRRRFPITPVVISVGKNRYKHPSKEVIDFFHGQANYELKRTDFNSVLLTSEKTIKVNSLLDVFSEEIPQDLGSGDKIFKLTNSEIELL